MLNEPITFTISDIVQLIKAITWLIGSIGVLASAGVWIWSKLRKPNASQNERLDALEKWQEEVNERLDQGDSHLGSIDKSNKVTQKALLALLAHGIDGNSIEPMREAKTELENFLIEKR